MPPAGSSGHVTALDGIRRPGTLPRLLPGSPAAGPVGLAAHLARYGPSSSALGRQRRRELIAEAGGIDALRRKSLQQTQLLMDLADRQLAPHGITVANPRSAAERGGHVALAHPEGWRICQALKAAGVIPDFRAPDVIRLAPSPLYTRYTECAEAVDRLELIMVRRVYDAFPGTPALVP